MPHPPSGVGCPYIGATPRIQWRRATTLWAWRGRIGRSAPEMLEMRHRDARAVAPSHQHAILGLAKIRDADGQPYPDRDQRHGKGKGRDVGQHAMAKVVRFVAVPFIAREV